MQKDREISDFQARMKKTEFKHNRDLKEAKIGEERAKNLLKEEKGKVDKLSKEAKAAQEQNGLLNMRLGELREERDREVAKAHFQYNALKDQVRSYQRILPTLTFLSNLGMRIENIPPYEDVYTRWKNKDEELVQLADKFEQFRKKKEEELKAFKQNEEMLKDKKMQIEKTLKEVLPRVVDFQQQVSELKGANEELSSIVEELKDENLVLSERGESFQASVREYQLKLQQLDRAYSCQLISKQEEIRALTQEQFDRYQKDIQSLQNKLQIKDNMYLQQISILEEEVYFLQGRINEEKEHFQDNYLAIRGEINRMREEIDQEREEHQWLKSKHENLLKQLNAASKMSEQLSAKVQAQQKTIESLRQLQLGSAKTFSDVQLSKMQTLQQSYNQLTERYEESVHCIARLEEENQILQEQTGILRSQLTNKNTPKPHTLELPQNTLQFQQRLRHQSGSFQGEAEAVLTVLQIPGVVRQRKKSAALPCRFSERQREKSSLGEDQQSIKAKESKTEEQLVAIKRQRQRVVGENMELKEKLSDLSKNYAEKEQALSVQMKNYNLMKSKVSSLEMEVNRLSEQDRRQKEVIKGLKEQLKQLKESSNQQLEKSIQQRKQLNAQCQQLRVERDRLKVDWSVREKAVMQEMMILKSALQGQQKLKKQILLLKKQREVYEKGIAKLRSQNGLLEAQIGELGRNNEVFRDSFYKQQKQILGLIESLDRERKERTLLAVPSLDTLSGCNRQEVVLNDFSQLLTRKQSQINFLQRSVSDLKQQIEGLKLSSVVHLQQIQLEQNEYIQTIIDMKMRCAQSEMKAAEAEHRLIQLKRKNMGNKHN